eukprot:gene21596-biopygen30291
MTMKSVVKWAGETTDPHGYAVYRASSIPKLVKDNWDKGDRGLGQIVHYLLNGTVKKTGKGSTEYYIFQEDTCRTGQKRQRVAEDMVHNELDVAYGGDHVTNEADATGAEWMHRIVEKIMGGDEAMARFLQRLLGYGITGEVREEVFSVWTGSGRNGKGLLTQALQQLLGAYYKEMNCAIISDSRSCSNIDAERAKLIGARLAVFNELKNGEKLKTNEVQLLTGGDGFPAKALYKDPVAVMPRHLAILETNYMPELSDVIVAMIERLLAIEFPALLQTSRHMSSRSPAKAIAFVTPRPF